MDNHNVISFVMVDLDAAFDTQTHELLFNTIKSPVSIKGRRPD